MALINLIIAKAPEIEKESGNERSLLFHVANLLVSKLVFQALFYFSSHVDKTNGKKSTSVTGYFLKTRS